MNENLRKKLAIMFLVLTISSFIFGLVITTVRFYNEQPEYRTDLPCYDKEGNVIIGVSCKEYVGGPNIYLLGVFLTVLFGVIAFYLYPKEQNENYY